MANLPQPNLDYTNKDFDAIRARVLSMIPSVFPDWTDYNIANFGNILVECFSFILDTLGFYQDNQAGEAFVISATQRKSLIALSKLILFVPSGASAVTADELFTLAEVPTNDVIIPAGTVVKTAEVTDPIRYQLLVALTIPALTDPPVGIGTVEHSESVQEVFTSSVLPNQEFDLGAVPFLDGSAVIQATNGLYTVVTNFLSSTASDRHVVLVVDQNDQASMKFGNGVNGEIPTGSITVDYKTGGGPLGNVEPGNIDRIEGSFTDVLSNPVSVTVTNPAKAAGGLARQSNASIKVQAPESLRVLNRTVAREDYEINAKKVTGVARALMLTSDQDPAIDENTGFLFVIPEGGGAPSTALKAAVLESVTVTFPNTLTFKTLTQDPLFLVVNVFAVVYLAEGADPTATKEAIEDALTRFFELTISEGEDAGAPNSDIDFGFNYKDVDGNPAGELALSDLFNVVRDTSGVRKIGDGLSEFTLNLLHQDVTLQLREFPTLGTVTLLNGDTQLPLV